MFFFLFNQNIRELIQIRCKSCLRIICRSAVGDLNNKYKHCLIMCKQLSTQEELLTHDEMKGVTLTADKLLYLHAIDLCLNAASLEFFGKAQEVIRNHSCFFVVLSLSDWVNDLLGNWKLLFYFQCVEPYTQAQILFHSLSQQATTECDRLILRQYREAVERRLHCLQNQGLVTLNEPSSGTSWFFTNRKKLTFFLDVCFYVYACVFVFICCCRISSQSCTFICLCVY